MDQAEELASKVEFSTNAPAGSDEHLTSLIPLQNAQQWQTLLVRTKWNAMPKNKWQDLENLLPVDAANSIIRDRQLSTIQQLVAIGIARITLSGNQNELARCQNAAEAIIRHRVRRNTVAILLSCYMVWHSSEMVEEAQSLWDRAHLAFASAPRVKRPPTSNEADLVELSRVTHKIIEGGSTNDSPDNKDHLNFRFNSRFKVVNAYRWVKERKAVIKQLGSASEADMLEFIVGNIPGLRAPELTSDEIHSCVRTARKMNRYLQSAGKIDPSITSDIRSRYFDTIIQHIDHCDEAAEKMLLKRDVQKFTTQLRKKTS